jgi:hypothetical protein
VEVQMPAKVHYTNINYYHNTEKEQVSESVDSHLKLAEHEMRVQRYTPAPLEGSKNHKFMRFKTSRLISIFQSNSASPLLSKTSNKLFFIRGK